MGTAIFLGNPPERIRQWIINHQPVSRTYWEQVVYNLENLPTATFVSDKTEFGDGELPAPGCALPIDYMTCDGYYDGSTFVPTLGKSAVMSNLDAIQAVSTEWIVLGYNGNVPKYIKYKNGSTYKYVSSTGSGSTRTAIVVGAAVYEKSWVLDNLGNSWTATGETVASVGSETFTYGQTNSNWGTTAGAVTYSVPMSINIGGTDYTFCGYTMTLNSRRLLCTSEDGTTCLTDSSFDAENYSNYWVNSKARSWCNLNTNADFFGVMDQDEWVFTYNSSNGLKLKLAKSQDLLKQVMPAVNRIWKYNGDTTEDVEDSFFFLSNGEINISNGDYTFKDANYNTAIFSTVFPEAGCPYYDPDEFYSDYLIKSLMNLDGSGSSADCWWLRSAYADDDYCVGFVDIYGLVSSYAADYSRGCSPAFVLG